MMMKKRVVWIKLLLLYFLFSWTTVFAQERFQIKENSVEMLFPENVDFRLSVSNQADIERIILKYGTNANSCQTTGSRQPVQFDSAKDVSVNWEWELQRSGSLPPGGR